MPNVWGRRARGVVGCEGGRKPGETAPEDEPTNGREENAYRGKSEFQQQRKEKRRKKGHS